MQFALPYIKSAGIPSGSLPNPINQDNELQTPTPTPTSPPPSTSPPSSASQPPPILPTASSNEQTEHTQTPLSVSTWCSSSQCHKNKTSKNDELFSEYLEMKMSKQNVNDIYCLNHN